MSDRITRLLQGLDLANGRGLEIGALFTPILRRPAHAVRYLDHLPTDALRAKYVNDPAVDPARIVAVDFVWTDEPLLELVGADAPFDHVVASHVIEHVPNLLGWLDQIGSVLSVGGALRLIVPDRRFTFDIARAETVLADVLAARLEERTRPAPREILDFYCNYQIVDRTAAAGGLLPPPDGASINEVALATAHARASLAGEYRDVHCQVFTPRSFAALMNNLARLGLIRFRCCRLDDTMPGEIDFFVHLARSDDQADLQESWAVAARELSAGVYGDAVLPQDEAIVCRSAIDRLEASRRNDRERVASLRLTLDHASSIRGAATLLGGALARRARRLINRACI